MKIQNIKYRWILIGMLTVLFLMVAAIISYFGSQNGRVSHTESRFLARFIENALTNNFTYNRNDFFWRYTLDELVRKGAHFSEYMLFGLISGILSNLLLRRVWLATAISLTVCSIYAYTDEYRQNFVLNRTPSWFDVKMDVTGAVIGIVLATIVLLILRYIHRLKRRIKELEESRGNQADLRSDGIGS
ncbi:MAG: VanZ family protein [Desulfitobacteriaceae bacterium]